MPGIPGVEGVGEIYAVGELVDKAFLHKHVGMPSGGTWQESVIANPDELVYVPNDLVSEMAVLHLLIRQQLGIFFMISFRFRQVTGLFKMQLILQWEFVLSS